MGEMLDMGTAVREAIGQCHEHWSGKGWPQGLKGEQISLAARLYILAHDVEISSRRGGTEAAIALVMRRSGKLYDPKIAQHFCAKSSELLARLNSVTPWDELLEQEVRPVSTVSSGQLDRMLETIASFIDSRSRYTLGHSRAVASFAETAGRNLGMSETEVTALRRSSLLHDLGRAGVPVAVWEKQGTLTENDVVRMKRHPSVTELILARSSSLGNLGTLAGLHHERIDGSGYRGVSESFLPMAARILATADAFQTRLEPRPHRAELSPDEASRDIQQLADNGGLDRDTVGAVIAAAGQPRPSLQGERAGGLSDRELEVLRQAVKGLSNREIGEALYISPRTVGHHIEHIYDKIGVSTRVGAALFAQQHGLL
jgi:HD-GYP domain-containing protein (c-di-GMP phosphodiesterase class II)